MGPVGGAPNASAGTRWRVRARVTQPARGQSLVEFALVIPLFLLLVFAIVEYSLINSAIGSYNFSAKDAARYGAIVGPTDTNADCRMLDLIDSRVIGVVAAQPVEVDIFEATESGAYSSSAAQDKYSYSPSSACANGAWTLLSHSWLPGPSGDCGTAACRDDRLVSQDYLGVHITYKYTYVTAFFSTLGATITLYADSVQRIEPQEIRIHPTPGRAPAIAALPPQIPQAPLLSMIALLPSWNFRAWRARGADEKERRS